MFAKLILIPLVATGISYVTLQPGPFSHEEFCLYAVDAMRRTKASPASWIKSYGDPGRSLVNCAAHRIEFKYYPRFRPSQALDNWQTQIQDHWSHAFCQSEIWREAIDRGWQIIANVIFPTSEKVSLPAKCN